MRSVRYYGPGDIRLEHDLPEPECAARQVKIRPAFCGICGSDLHAYQSPDTIPHKDRPHPLTGETWPLTLGHEFSGEIVQIGAEVSKGLQIGDRVAVQPTICCDRCIPCREGLLNCCDSFGFLGVSGRGGGLSDYVCVEARFVFKLPGSVPLEIGALVEPLAVAWHAIERSEVKPGNSVLIMGAGPIGLAVLQCLRTRQPARIIVADVDPNRRKFAARFGATRVIDPLVEDVVLECKRSCDGQGPEIAFDCAGVAASIKTACLSSRSRGTVVNVALWETDMPFNMNHLLFGEKRVLTALSYTTADFEHVIEALGSGSLEVKGMVTRMITIDRVVEDGILGLIHGKGKEIKILIDVRK